MQQQFQRQPGKGKPNRWLIGASIYTIITVIFIPGICTTNWLTSALWFVSLGIVWTLVYRERQGAARIPWNNGAAPGIAPGQTMLPQTFHATGGLVQGGGVSQSQGHVSPLLSQLQQPAANPKELAVFAAAVRIEVGTVLDDYVSKNLISPQQVTVIAGEVYMVTSSLSSKEAILQALQQLGNKYPVIQDVYTHIIQSGLMKPSLPTAPLPVQQSTPSTPPPAQSAPSNLPKDAVILGKDTGTGESISVSQTARRQGMYVIGKNGTGKTTFLVHLMLQDIQAGMGLCFIDPHGDAIADVLRRLPPARKKDVILLDVLDTKYPFGLNLYECADPTDLELAARSCEQVMHVFEKVWGAESKNPSWGPAMEDLLRNVALTLVHNQGMTLAEVPMLLTDEEARKKIVDPLTNTQLRLFWNQYGKRKDKNEYMASTLNKVRAFLSNPIVEHIVGQPHTTIDFRKIMDEGKILLVNLPGRYEDITSLIGAVFIGQLLNAALSRVDTPEANRRQFNLYADEYQRFATPDFATLLAESRKFAIASTIAHQFRDQLDDANRGATLNAANMIVFRISGEDGEELAKEFDCTPPPPEVTGQRPVLVPKQDVIRHLIEQGHPNQNAMKFQVYLQIFREYTGELIDGPQYLRGAEGVLDGTIMFLRNRSAAKQHQQAVDLQQDAKMMLHNLNHWFYQGMLKRDITLELPLHIFQTAAKLLEFDKLLRYTPHEQEQEIVALLCRYEVAGWERAQWLISPQTLRDQEAMQRCMKFLHDLRLTFFTLCNEPVLVDSGRWEPILDKPRSYADVQNQIATDLANLRQFHAKGKLGHTEVMIQTLPLPAGVDDTALQQQRAAIQQTTRDTYCTPRQKVEQEIVTRQAQLTTVVAPQRKTKQEEII